VAHSSREEAKKNWDAMLADPDVQEGGHRKSKSGFLASLGMTN